MTDEYNREYGTGSSSTSGVFDDFKAMPLEDKISNLFKMELETLNELLRVGADCAMSALEKVGDAISGFGSKLEHEAKAATDANKTEAGASSPGESNFTAASPDEAYPVDAGYTPPDRSDKPFD